MADLTTTTFIIINMKGYLLVAGKDWVKPCPKSETFNLTSLAEKSSPDFNEIGFE
jgi:hypothetical protein